MNLYDSRSNSGYQNHMNIPSLHSDTFNVIHQRDAAWRKGKIVGAKTSPAMRPSLDRALLVEVVKLLVGEFAIGEVKVTETFQSAAQLLGRTT